MNPEIDDAVLNNGSSCDFKIFGGGAESWGQPIRN